MRIDFWNLELEWGMYVRMYVFVYFCIFGAADVDVDRVSLSVLFITSMILH